MNRVGTAVAIALLFSATSASANTACDGVGPLTIIAATDDGMFDDVSHSPASLLDGSLDPDSRWSNESQGSPKELVFDLGAQQTLKGINVAFYKGDERQSNFKIEASVDGKTYQTIVADRQSGGTTLDFEKLEFDAVKAQYVKYVGNGNTSNNWNSLTEFVATGCGVAVEKPKEIPVAERKGNGLFGLHTDRPPSENFDLKGWYMTTPADDDGDGKSDSVYENELAAGWTDPRFFYTDPATGGMVFRVTPAGAKTSKNTSYTRSELRGMMRRGDYNIETRLEGGIPNKNNWVFSSAPKSAQAAAGGVNGKMTATLAVNQVTRQGKAYQVGRVVIGQIHAKNDEPIRLYYRKLPKNKYGSIYFAHDPEVGKESWVDVIGKRANKTPNPADGIALDEVFSYEIEVKGKKEGDVTIPMLHLKIIRDDGTEVVAEPFDMRASGFNVENEFMYFKAGAYTGNNSSPEPETDFDKVIFYKLEASHDPAAEATPEMKAKAAAAKAAAAIPAMPAKTGIVFDDSFADGSRDDGADATDSNWWTTSTSSAIEVKEGSLGLVSGGSGRGIRTTFAPQTLADGQTIKATYSFTTPAKVGEKRGSAFRVGMYDKLGRAVLEGDLSASSKKPNTNYDGLPGYMIDFDIKPKKASDANIEVRKHTVATHGRLLGTTKGYKSIGKGGEPYDFTPETSYVGTFSIKKMGADLEITGTLSQDGKLLSEFSQVDAGSDTNNFGMLAFHVNSKTFGSSKKKDTPDNGIDFTNVKVEILSGTATKAAAMASASTDTVVFDDSFADGDRSDSADATDTNWWQTTNSAALEIEKGALGLVTGGSGRGLRTTFEPQALVPGKSVKATFTFITPETIGTKRSSAFRIGMYDKAGRAALEGDLSASSKKPNVNYDGLPGYMISFDVGTPTAKIVARKHGEKGSTGRLLGTTKGYTDLKGGGETYAFAPDQTYTGTMTVMQAADGVTVSGSLSQDGKVLSEFSAVDAGGKIDSIGMLAFHVNSKTFGSSKKKGTPDNGIDFKNVKVETLN